MLAETCSAAPPHGGGSGGGLQQASEHRIAVVDVFEIDEHRDELVPADACQRVALPQRLLHA